MDCSRRQTGNSEIVNSCDDVACRRGQSGKQAADKGQGTTARKVDDILAIGRKLYSELSERGVGAAGFSVGGKPKSTRDTGLLSQETFHKASGFLRHCHIVVFIDEAQNTPIESTTQGVVDCLHNPPDEIPLIASFFGLSDTAAVLRQCGLSRPASGRVLNLEPLAHEDAKLAMQSIFDAYGFKDTAEDRTLWVNQLAELSQGWPQHMNNVAVAAAQVIRDHGGVVREELLPQASRQGQALKDEYYAFRLAACSGRSWVYKALAIAAKERKGVLSWDEIDRLTRHARSRTGQSIDDFLVDALHAGVLMPTKNLLDHYQIFIPSLRLFARFAGQSTAPTHVIQFQSSIPRSFRWQIE